MYNIYMFFNIYYQHPEAPFLHQSLATHSEQGTVITTS